MSDPVVRNPRAEAQAQMPDGYEARVLEPSPPANTDPDWFADDPTDPGGAQTTVVSPIPGEGITWDDVITRHPEIGRYASEHWLGSFRRLEPMPDGYEVTRDSLHQVAFYAVAPKRHASTGKLGLRYTYGGFGVPFFGDDEQVRVEGGTLVHQQRDRVSSTSLTTLADTCEFLDIPYREVWFADFHDPLPPVGPDAVLEVDPSAAESIGAWLGFATLVLEMARRTPGATDLTRVQLWPEHFDPAFEMGSYELGHRASYGASAGDDAHQDPYLYVASWGEVDRSDPYWNDLAFNGASLSYRDLLESENQIDTALGFLHEGYRRLTRDPVSSR